MQGRAAVGRRNIQPHCLDVTEKRSTNVYDLEIENLFRIRRILRRLQSDELQQ